MSASSNPWMKFYPADWRADPALRMCSIAARGLWMEILCLMHEATPRGSLLVNGLPVSGKQLAVLSGITPRELGILMDELEAAGVFSKEDNGTVYSRRIRRDVARAERDKANGKGGGNPSLKGGVNPQDNGVDKAQNPEVRTQTQSLCVSSLPDSLELKEVSEEKAWGREFCAFWHEYPHKVGKKAAHASFLKARKTIDFAALMAALTAYTNKTDDRPWCNPATWLNQGRWDDEPAKPTIGGAVGALARLEQNLQSRADSEAGEDAFVGLPERRFG